jgi:hypothetical protein
MAWDLALRSNQSRLFEAGARKWPRKGSAPITPLLRVTLQEPCWHHKGHFQENRVDSIQTSFSDQRQNRLVFEDFRKGIAKLRSIFHIAQFQLALFA